MGLGGKCLLLFVCFANMGSGGKKRYENEIFKVVNLQGFMRSSWRGKVLPFTLTEFFVPKIRKELSF